jgi:hypothetical protein
MIKSRSSSHHLLENDKVEQKEVRGRKWPKYLVLIFKILFRK